MKVIILSSGKGTRMMPLTENTPKPMLEINGQSLLQNKIDLCKAADLTEININVAYKKNVIIDFIKASQENINIFDEGDEPLGTAQGIRNISKDFDNNFIVINSDIWTDYELKKLKDTDLNENLAHIILVKTPSYLKGDFDINDNKISVGTDYVFSGIGKYDKNLFENHKNKELGDILRAEEKIAFSIYDGVWMDVGTPERLEQIRQLEQDPK
ncbi:MAG: sugar phosphate nucleotidyltransferase [Gammaproteobacteria bacterium]|jgi:MurNAc alpha-1-phosphate uridylyltransferase